MKNYILLLLAAAFTTVSCIRPDSLEQQLKTLKSIPIEMDFARSAALTDSASIIDKWNLILFFDSTECSTCKLRGLGRCDEFVKAANDRSTGVWFIVAPKKEKNDITRFTLKALLPKSANVVIDSQNIFAKTNSHIPSNPDLHAFLLDSNNNVVLVGNPMQNKKVGDLFWEIISKE